jgi:DNA-binding beta-propeller fold protein YncE
LWGITLDNSGNFYVADHADNKIRKISSAGIVSTIAGNGTRGNVDGPAAIASFNSPAGISVDPSGNLYVADYGNGLIRKISPSAN